MTTGKECKGKGGKVIDPAHASSPITLLTGRSPHLLFSLFTGWRAHPWPWRRQRSIKPLAGGRARQRRAAL